MSEIGVDARTQEPQPQLRIEKFTADPETDGKTGSRFAQWLEAVNIGFHEPRNNPDDLPETARAFASDERILWGAYDDAPASAAWGRDIPVATYATMVNTLNVGGGNLLATHQVTDVTVRSTHRRQGLLRRIMTDDLRSAAANGYAVAALTASEATIYGRFGFGTATFSRSVEVDVSERFALLPGAYGSTALVSPQTLLEAGPGIFERFHQRTRGSVDRQYSYPRRASGLWGERPEEDRAVRSAVHYDDDGHPDGYVSYKFAGWETKPYTIRIVDLVAASDAANLELWRHLGSVDLVQRVSYDLASEEDPLPWALADRRCHRITADADVLWIRVLDPVKALEARTYERDGTCSFAVFDSVGLAVGRFSLTVFDGKAVVQPLEETAGVDVSMDVTDLGSLYLGGVGAAALAAAGRVTEVEPGGIARLDGIFRASVAPYCITHF